jgi:hypothetical protein
MNARSIAASALALAFFAVSCQGAAAKDAEPAAAPAVVQDQAPAVAQEPTQNHEDWNRQHHTRFNDQDRQATRDWYRQNHRGLGAGWRQRDRLSPDLQGRLRVGRHLDPRLRGHMHPLPGDLSRRYGAAPSGYRYMVIGGNVVMLDHADEVHDVFSITLQMP